MNSIEHLTQNAWRLLIPVFASALMLAVGTPVAAQDEESAEAEESAMPEPPDLSRWQCRSCPFKYGWSGSILFGPGYVSDDFFEFGNYRGLEQQGVYGALGVDLIWRAEDARYLDIYGERLGLDSRTLAIETGKQGSYKIFVGWDQITHYRAQDTRTPFLGAGSNNQTLPEDWVLGGVTQDMSALDESLQGINIDRGRRTLRLGVEFGGESPWRYRADVSRTSRNGNAIRGASFIFRATELAAPIDYSTTRLDTGIAYVKDRWQLDAAYTVSLFENDNQFLQWENPFTGIFGAQLGQLAEPPDNQFHQFMLSGSWNQSRYLSLAGQVAIGRMQQDESFVRPTVNLNLTNPALPRANLNGEIDTRIINFRATSNLTRNLRARVQFRYDERDNDSPRDAYTQVITDTFVTRDVINEPYGFDRTSVDASLDYRMFSFLNLTASGERKEMDRTLQEVEETITDTYSLQARVNLFERLSLRAEYEREQRDNDLDPALLGPGVNPDLRRFHYAEKDRDAIRISADYALLDNLFLGAFAEIADEDFKDVQIGLSDARAESYGIDLSASFSQKVSAHAFVAFERLEADISGADGNSSARWFALQDDEFRTAGIGINFDELPGKWVGGSIDVSYAAANGEISIAKRSTVMPEFPRLKTRRFTLEASLERALRENLNLRLGYLVGKLSEDDFYRDNVLPDTVPLLLSLGEQTPDRTVHVISAMLRYRFQ